MISDRDRDLDLDLESATVTTALKSDSSTTSEYTSFACLGRNFHLIILKGRSDEDEDACSKLWNVYIGEAQRYDQTLLQGWKKDMDGILLFSALYSASLTAFIIESYKNLQQDPAEVTTFLLAQIVQQLASNGTAVLVQTPLPFQPTTSSLLCNILWFLSLALALTCSLLATFVQQWTRDFIHKTSMRPSPVRHARILAFAYFGMRNFGMHTFIDVIPMLLHLSLFLFFAGLIGFLLPVNRILTYMMSGILVIIFVCYIFLSCLPVLRLASPYRTPFSNALWHLTNTFSRWFPHGCDANSVQNGRVTSLTEAVLQKSLDGTAERDLQAIKFTMRSLTDDAELLPLIEAIPDVIHGPDGIRHANVQLIAPFFDFSDPQLNMRYQYRPVTHPFMSTSSAWTDPTFRTRNTYGRS
ncbi:hypothetical protein K435DRAFT_769723 [Dendrothele bispora CBS 962.96]|uniref:DUF6535 domain-containing protein n=1 Tax=Dendrothele bispora (strain CBS 962.96) TaxID=1314807 RepID=A0A4S8KQQ7_DENBC|nr:hypothetical protein K435DRAFT_769723 [Dendrothele bispora CBS 962.96]